MAPNSNNPKNFLVECWQSRSLLKTMIWRDVKSRFAGSALGLVWAFLQPICMMAILWFVFTYGLKASPGGSNLPFIAWFFPAQIAWNFFQEGLLSGSGAITDYSYLVRKINFKIELLPIVKIGSALVFHGIFLLIIIAVLVFSGVYPNTTWPLVLYFTISAITLLIGLSWLTSSLTVLFRDVQQLLGIIAQLGFWGTPIIWRADSLPASMRPWLALNPVYYITEGYRVAFTRDVSGAPWSDEIAPYHSLVFWIMTVGILICGKLIFKKLKPYFGDVL